MGKVCRVKQRTNSTKRSTFDGNRYTKLKSVADDILSPAATPVIVNNYLQRSNDDSNVNESGGSTVSFRKHSKHTNINSKGK